MIIDPLVFVNAILGLFIVGANIVAIRLMPRELSWRWVKIAYALIGLLWFALYTGLVTGIISNQHDPFNFSASVVRPLITITLAVLVASSIITIRRYWALWILEHPKTSVWEFIKNTFRAQR